MAVAYLIIPFAPGLQGVSGLGSAGVLGGLLGGGLGGSLDSSGCQQRVLRPVPTDCRRSRGLSVPSAPSAAACQPTGGRPAAVAPLLSLPQLVLTECGVPLLVAGGALQPLVLPAPLTTVNGAAVASNHSSNMVSSITSNVVSNITSSNTAGIVSNTSSSVKMPLLAVVSSSAQGGRLAGGRTGQHRSQADALTQQLVSKDPLSGWMQQKLPPAAADYCWEYPLLPAEPDPVPATDAGIPEDLQDLFLDSPGTVPALPDDNANTILEDLISDSVREHPELFGDLVTPEPRCADLIAICSPSQLSPQSADLMPSPSASDFSPSPPQMSLEAWAPTVSPSTCEPWSPPSVQADCELTSGPDWSPRLETPPGRRRQARPRPYDKTDRLNGGRKGQLTEEERRERKKEQNKNAATRYRQKKKEEHVVVSCDQDILETRNKQLRSRVLGLTKELTYLKQLMRDVLRHRPAAV